MSQDPYKPAKHVDTGVPADYPSYPQQQQQQQQQQPYGHPQQMYPPPPYATAPAAAATGAPPPQYIQVDQFGRPIVNAVPAHVVTHVVPNNANIRHDAQGNALCNKCSAPYPLPAGCTSWRCRNCGELNNASLYGDECCTIL